MTRVINSSVAAALALGVVFVFADPLLAMMRKWDTSPMYSYGYTVPAISLFLLWVRRDKFQARPLRPARLSGVAIIALALLMQVLGQVASIQVIQQIGFLVAIVGVVLFLFGTNYLAVSAPAIAYLLFMVPIWDTFTEPLHWPFQNYSAQLGVALMQWIGIPVYRDGTFIALPNLLLEVARECSGINYLIAVLALALPLAFLRLRQNWRRVLLVVSALTIAALANGLRVALIGTLAHYEVGSPLHGPFHVLHGLFVAGIGYVVLFVGLQALQKGDSASAVDPSPSHPITALPSHWHLREAFGLAAIFWTLVLVGVTPQVHGVLLAKPLETLPERLGDWTLDPTGTVADPPDDTLLRYWNGANRTLARRYRGADGRTVTVAIWYFESQQQGRELINHSVSDLHRQSLPAALPLPDGTTLRANKVQWEKSRQAGLFWYDLGVSSESDQYVTKLRSLWNVLRSGRSNGAAIMLRTDGDATAFVALENFAKEVQPALSLLWFGDTNQAGAGGARSR